MKDDLENIPSTEENIEGAHFGKHVSQYDNYGRAGSKHAKSFDKMYQAYDGSVAAKPKKKRKGPVFWISLFIMIAALIAIAVLVGGYVEGCMKYKNIADDVFKDRNELNLADMKVDWDKLLATNPDTVGWVYCPDTAINYPVVHTDNNDKYLKTSFEGYQSYVSYGTIFVDYHNKHDLSDQNIVSYGHHMNDGSMYSAIADMKEEDFLNSHKTIYFLTPNGNYRLCAFTLCHVDASEPIVQTNFSTPQKMTDYIQDKINRGVSHLQPSIPDPALMSKIFTFSTCDNYLTDGRYILFAYVAESTVAGVNGLEK
ncbi:MAG: class B sortase [Coriobacteriia bacterium]|nr:class B sortase [Coriobacteriia bacterium]